jgi:hypothetical protein
LGQFLALSLTSCQYQEFYIKAEESRWVAICEMKELTEEVVMHTKGKEELQQHFDHLPLKWTSARSMSRCRASLDAHGDDQTHGTRSMEVKNSVA